MINAGKMELFNGLNDLLQQQQLVALRPRDFLVQRIYRALFIHRTELDEYWSARGISRLKKLLQSRHGYKCNMQEKTNLSL